MGISNDNFCHAGLAGKRTDALVDTIIGLDPSGEF